MPTVGQQVTQMTGLTEDQIFDIIKSQIGMIMTEPFSNLNLMALVPQMPRSKASNARCRLRHSAG